MLAFCAKRRPECKKTRRVSRVWKTGHCLESPKIRDLYKAGDPFRNNPLFLGRMRRGSCSPKRRVSAFRFISERVAQRGRGNFTFVQFDQDPSFMQQNEPFLRCSLLAPREGNPLKHRLTIPE